MATYQFCTGGNTGPLHTFTAWFPQNGNKGTQAEWKVQGTITVF